MTNPLTWERQSPGWYTSEAGGICRESGHGYLFRGPGWYFYPQDDTREPRGPYKTLTAAKRAAGRVR